MVYRGQTSRFEPPREPRGIQITISGPRRSGKTTLANKLLDLLTKEGYATCISSTYDIMEHGRKYVDPELRDYDVLIIDETIKYCPHCQQRMKEEEF